MDVKKKNSSNVVQLTEQNIFMSPLCKVTTRMKEHIIHHADSKVPSGHMYKHQHFLNVYCLLKSNL